MEYKDKVVIVTGGAQVVWLKKLNCWLRLIHS